MRILEKDFKYQKNVAYIGNIQVSKAVIWTKMKKAQEEVQAKKLMQKHFYTSHKESNLNEEFKAPSLSSIPSIPSSPFDPPTSKFIEDDKEMFYDNSENINNSNTKLMWQSKKIFKTEGNSQPLTIRHRIAKPGFKAIHKTSSMKTKNGSTSEAKMKESTTKTSSTDLETPKDFRKFEHEELIFENLTPMSLFRNNAPYHETLSYSTNDNSRHYQFHCFKDSDLVPKNFAKYIIEHDMDDDCATDDEQIKTATNSMHFSLKFAASD